MPMPTTPITLYACMSGRAFCAISSTLTGAAESFAAELDAAGVHIDDAPRASVTMTMTRGDMPEIVGALLTGYGRAHMAETIADL